MDYSLPVPLRSAYVAFIYTVTLSLCLLLKLNDDDDDDDDDGERKFTNKSAKRMSAGRLFQTVGTTRLETRRAMSIEPRGCCNSPMLEERSCPVGVYSEKKMLGRTGVRLSVDCIHVSTSTFQRFVFCDRAF